MRHGFSQTFALAHGATLCTGTLKRHPEDFIVTEQLSFPFTGSGEHLYLQIRKRSTNTHWLLQQLAQHFGCPARDIGYAGLKDRQAITTQWFSLPAKFVTDTKLAAFQSDTYSILDVHRHQGKLRRGAIKENHFAICVRDVSCDPQALTQRLTSISSIGVPNYFGEQRFGIARNNLGAADRWCQRPHKLDRFRRGLYLSAMRAWLFNLVLAQRIEEQNWCQPLTGEVYALAGSKRFFHEAAVSDELQARLRSGDIHLSGPLWGSGELLSSSVVRERELAVLADWEDWRACLERAGLKQERRALRVLPRNLTHAYDKDKRELCLEFALPAGSYATGLVRELVISGGELELADE